MKTSKAPTTLVLYGAPASGKSTQALLVGEQLGASVLQMGAVLRKLAKGKSELAKKVAVKVNSGQLVSADMAAEIIAEFLSHNRGKVMLLEGVMRNINQARKIAKLLKEEDREMLLVVLTLTKAESLKRMQARFKKENRVDDADKQAIKNRFDLYKEESTKLIEFFKDNHIKVSGTGTVKQVTARLLKAIKAHDPSYR